MQFFPIFEGLSKTVKNRQKPLESTVILVFEGSLAPPKTIKNVKKRQKPLDHTVISRFDGVTKTVKKKLKIL
jgi:hypothetical protein